MKKRIFIFLLMFIFALSQLTPAYAKGFSGGRSFSGRSFGKSYSSKGYSGSSKSGLFGKSSGSKGYSGSSKASGAASGSSSSAKRGLGSYSSRSSTMKSSYMQDAMKKQASTRSYKTYKQNLNSEQQKAYDQSFNKSYNVNNRMNFEDAMRTRNQRINSFNTRQSWTRANTGMFGGGLMYGSAFVGPWDLFFLMTASNLFWYHHWAEISAHRAYFDANDFAAREAAYNQYKAEGKAQDPSYLEPGVDPDLQFSEQYQQSHPGTVYKTNKYSPNPVVVLVIVVVIAGGLFIIIRRLSRPKPRRTFNSRIY